MEEEDKTTTTTAIKQFTQKLCQAESLKVMNTSKPGGKRYPF